MASRGASVAENSLGAASTESPETCLASSVERKLASRRLGFSTALTVEYSVTIPRLRAASPRGRPRSINNVLWLDSWATETAKLAAIVVTPTPPFAPRKTKTFLAVLLAGWDEWPRTEIRDRGIG